MTQSKHKPQDTMKTQCTECNGQGQRSVKRGFILIREKCSNCNESGNVTQTIDHQGLTQQEQATAENLKTGLAIFLLLALIGAVLDLLV